MTAADALGRDHPLTRATRRFESACLQFLSGLTILAAIVIFAHGPARRLELAIGIGTCAVLTALVVVSRSNRRQRAMDVINAGNEDLPLRELEPVRQRLRDSRRRALLAGSLERYLRYGERWPATPASMRPVANVRLLVPLENDVRDIARLLRADAIQRVRGVALVEWLLSDGVSSPLFKADGDALRRELGRIRFALSAV
jgi:hypothetical protein